MDKARAVEARSTFIKCLEASLFQDARDLLMHDSGVPRYALDCIYREIKHRTHAQVAQEYKAFQKRLCSEFYFGENPEVFGVKLRIDGSPASLRALRQWLGFFSREHAAVSSDIARACLEATARRWVSKPTSFAISPRELYAIQTEVDTLIGPTPPRLDDLFPKHGPGAVATCEKGPQKMYFKETYIKLDTLLGYDSEALFRLPHQPPLVLERRDPVTRTVCVPKDATAVRVISCEPLSMQFLEQGLMHWFYERFERMRGKPFPLYQQTLQQERARLGSCIEAWGRRTQPCTIDLSNASDTVKCVHIRLFFSREWQELLFALRSEAARFPGGAEFPLETFAPMGSAICYPVECIVFLAVARAAARLTRNQGEPLGCSAVGDDLVVPAYAYAYTLDLLSRLAFEPNVGKCCGPSTRFREACGGDFWDGVAIDIVRPRFIPSLNRHGWGPMATLAARLSAVGFEKTANVCAQQVRGPVALGADLPYFPSRLHWPVIGRVRWNTAWQRFEQQTVAEVPLSGIDSCCTEGWEPLFQWFTSRWRSETPFSVRTRTAFTYLPVEGTYKDAPVFTPPGWIGRWH
jgi:hypothetical protein